ncbi:butyrophilin subfamily 1 member A1-like [Pelodiscus sinensis]|uniref:butyrophilin subfamily 1 member A1-like n=1 Tax=Pelodiscus sinensis TaxID=13735 RepID=UPI003F6AAD7B
MKVLSICHCSTASSSLPEFIIFFIMFYVHKLESARFAVVGPGHPVTAIAGGDIMLPCRLLPSMSVENMEVRWFQHEFTSFVHLYRHGEEEFGQQMAKYRDRTKLSKADITDGIVDLKIIEVRPSDEGQYRCFVGDGDFHDEAVLELKVAAVGSAPRISVAGHQDGGIRVVCQSAGWYPQPQVLWRDSKGQPLSALTETKAEEEGGFFKIKNSIVITENTKKNLSCSLRNTHVDQEKESITFSISDSFFPRTSPWMVVWSVTLVILLVSIGLTLFLFKLRGKLHTELEQRRSFSDAANVTLDPATAQRDLVLSEDGKRVSRAETQQLLPDNPEKFDSGHCVLGREGFTSGRHRWEVVVEDGVHWAVGVARKSGRGKGAISPEEGIWAVGRWGDQFQALTDPVTPLTLSQAPSRIRVCLDCDGGQVTFTDAGTEASIFTFPPGSLSGIRPWLWVGSGSQLSLSP